MKIFRDLLKLIFRNAVGALGLSFILILAAPHASAQKAGRKRATKSKPKSQDTQGTAPQVPEEETKKLADVASESRANLLSASQAYRESLEHLLELQQKDVTRAREVVEKRKELLDLGVIAKREFEESGRALTEAQE